MSKERINVTVDKAVKERAQARSDLNVSGAVNEYLDRVLRGDSRDVAAERTEIKSLREEADELREKAEAKEAEANRRERELETHIRDREQELKEAAKELKVATFRSSSSPYVDTDDEEVAAIADEIGVEPQKLKQKAIELFEDNANDPTYQ